MSYQSSNSPFWLKPSQNKKARNFFQQYHFWFLFYLLQLVSENSRLVFRDNIWWGAQKIWMCYYVSKLLSFAYDMIKTLQTRINQLYIFGSCLQFVDMYQIGTYFLFIRLQQPILNKNNCSFLKWFDLKIRPGGLFFSQIVY